MLMNQLIKRIKAYRNEEYAKKLTKEILRMS
jgi:hypothetical protein